MSDRKKTLAVDFDGVIHKYRKGFHDGTIYDEPMKKAKKGLEELVAAGWQVVIFTTRLNPQFGIENSQEQRAKIIDWLEQHGMFEHSHWHDVTNNKPAAIAYIDDRAIRFTNWSDIRKMFA